MISPLQRAVGTVENEDHFCDGHQVGNHHKESDQTIGVSNRQWARTVYPAPGVRHGSTLTRNGNKLARSRPYAH